MGLRDFIEKLIYSSAEDEVKDKIDMINAGSLESIFESAKENGIDLFDASENNGYVKNNNEEIQKHLSFINPNFSARDFVDWAKLVFKEVTQVNDRNALDREIIGCVDKEFDFSSVKVDSVYGFSVSYLHLFKRTEDTEILQACISVLESAYQSDREAKRYFMRFKRPSQFKIVEMRRVKTTACPSCGAPVFFGNSSSAKCSYCGQYVTFQEYGWTLFEVEKITADTQINNMGVV